MSTKIQTLWGDSIPPAPRHAITVHMPSWETVVRFAERDPALMASFKKMYPRMIPHSDVKELTQAILKIAGAEGQVCMLFPSPESASECKDFAISPKRGEDALSPDDISIRLFDINVRFYAVFFPAPKAPLMQSFWCNAGVGISSRLAEASLKHVELLHEASNNDAPPQAEKTAAYTVLRERIAGLLERAPVGPARSAKVSPDDVYLFQTGMAAIYSVHQFLLRKHNGSTVLFGFAFPHTMNAFRDFGSGFKHFGLGTAEELDQLEDYLKAESSEGRKVQAVWAEFPSNPLVVTPDLDGLRKLADKYHFALIIDDTIGSFCNVDLLGAADIVVTSLTKSFSGYSDVMGASAVLSPSSSLYPELKPLFRDSYHNDLFALDAETLEQNSRDYLPRSTILNANAARLVAYLSACAADPNSAVSRVYYPSLCWSRPHYTARMRTPTADFTPGFGGLFSVEFESVDATRAFYDGLDVHQGPHLGAHVTIALPFVKGLYGKQLEWAGAFGLRETQIRVATGLEDGGLLEEVFRAAVGRADKMRGRG
ncbi:hypothetical protein MMC30_004765 [Trapelia coarctata]|nr:hypothetical protein [Trapelia coarctata]